MSLTQGLQPPYNGDARYANLPDRDYFKKSATARTQAPAEYTGQTLKRYEASWVEFNAKLKSPGNLDELDIPWPIEDKEHGAYRRYNPSSIFGSVRNFMYLQEMPADQRTAIYKVMRTRYHPDKLVAIFARMPSCSKADRDRIVGLFRAIYEHAVAEFQSA